MSAQKEIKIIGPVVILIFLITIISLIPSLLNSDNKGLTHKVNELDGVTVLEGGNKVRKRSVKVNRPRTTVKYKDVKTLLYTEPHREGMCFITRKPTAGYVFPEGIIESGHPFLRTRTYPSYPRLDTCHKCFPYVYHNILKPSACSEEFSTIKVLMLVTTTPVEYEFRMAIRQTWGQSNDTKRVIFLFGTGWSKNEQDIIIQEHNEFRDILQDSFIDSNFNATLKVLSGLHWWKADCKMAPLIVRTTTDDLVDIDQLLKGIDHSPYWDNKIIGRCEGELVSRDLQDKFYLTLNEYPYPHFPMYSSGFTYAMTSRAANKIIGESPNIPHFIYDDVYFGLVMKYITGKASDKTCIHRDGYIKYNPKKIYLVQGRFTNIEQISDAETLLTVWNMTQTWCN